MQPGKKASHPRGAAAQRPARLPDTPGNRGADQASFASRHSLLAAAALLLLVLVAYSPLVRAGFIWDDNDYVTDNPTLVSVDGLRRMWLEPHSLPQYYPLVHTTYWTEYHLWALHPLGYHLVNVLLHATSAILLWQLLQKLQVPGAWLAAALFAVHPVEVESVAWITERKNVLSLALALGSLLCYLRFAPVEPASANDPRRWRFYAFAFALFLGGMLSKTVVASLPAVVLVIVWWKRGRIGWSDVRPLIPFFALGIGLAWLTMHLEVQHVGATGADFDLSLAQRVLIAGRAAWFYAGKLAWPYPLIFFYPRWNVDPAVAWQWIYPMSAVCLLGVLWLVRQRIGRGPLAAALIFGGVLVPALGFVDVYPFRFSFVADHFQYHASTALIALAAATAVSMFASTDPRKRALSAAAAALMLGVLCTLTFLQAFIYRDLETLYRDTIAKNPSSWIAHQNLGGLLDEQGQYEEALAMLRTAADLQPREAGIRNRLGHVLMQLGDQRGFRPGELDEAIRHMTEGVRLNPQDADAQSNLGFAVLQANRPADALVHFRSAIALRPGFARAWYGEGSAQIAAGQWSEAQRAFEQALAAEPNDADAHQALAVALLHAGQLDAAAQHLRAALAQDPNFAEAHNVLADLLAEHGDLTGAADHYRQVLRQSPADVATLNKLGAVLFKLGRTKEARDCFTEVLRLDPENAEAKVGLQRAR